VNSVYYYWSSLRF